jgi:hypothetical protein
MGHESDMMRAEVVADEGDYRMGDSEHGERPLHDERQVIWHIGQH